jgi:membrane-associated phospholipid phosphatase
MSQWFRIALAETREATVYVVRWWRLRRWVLLATLLLCIVVLGLMWTQDKVWLAEIQTISCEHNAKIHNWAEWFSAVGNFWYFNGPILGGLLLWSWWRRSAYLRRLAVITLVGTLLTGSIGLIVRSVSGRPRPTAQRADGFYGPSPSYQMQAFPSGHAAAVFGTAIPILLGHPLAGAPLTAAASTVGWSRLYLNRHHPTDVIASLLLAILVSIPLRQWLLVSRPR